MTRQPNDTRDRILETAYRLFYDGGYSRVSLDNIAAAAGLTKKTLYYHFDSKDALVAAVLDNQRSHALTQIQGWASDAWDDPAAMVGGLFEKLGRWAAKPSWRGSGFTRIAMELADLPGHPARQAADRHKAEVEAWLTERFRQLGVEDAERTAQQIMLLIEGCLSLILIHRNASYAEAAADAARQLVRVPGKA